MTKKRIINEREGKWTIALVTESVKKNGSNQLNEQYVVYRWMMGAHRKKRYRNNLYGLLTDKVKYRCKATTVHNISTWTDYQQVAAVANITEKKYKLSSQNKGQDKINRYPRRKCQPIVYLYSSRILNIHLFNDDEILFYWISLCSCTWSSLMRYLKIEIPSESVTCVEINVRNFLPNKIHLFFGNKNKAENLSDKIGCKSYKRIIFFYLFCFQYHIYPRELFNIGTLSGE